MLELLAPAKINLTLAVIGRRTDGFHEIESLVVPIGLHDRLVFAPAPSLGLHNEPQTESIGPPADNLVCKAARALARVACIPCGAAIHLEKRIPVGGGLGGGSSDAAAALLGLNRLWQLNWPVDRLASIAQELGSDVPFFLNPRCAIMRGRGEKISHCSFHPQGFAAIVVPPFGLSTRDVYSVHASRFLGVGVKSRPQPTVWSNCREMMGRLFNELEPAAFAVEPRLAQLHRSIQEKSDRSVRMTGSGSALFSLFDNPAEAETWKNEAVQRLKTGVATHIVPLL